MLINYSTNINETLESNIIILLFYLFIMNINYQSTYVSQYDMMMKILNEKYNACKIMHKKRRITTNQDNFSNAFHRNLTYNRCSNLSDCY